METNIKTDRWAEILMIRELKLLVLLSYSIAVKILNQGAF
jgi:hypothetical protein